MASPEFSTQIVPEPQKSAQGRSFQNILDFLAEATPTPRVLKTEWPPRHKNQSEESWQRDFKIAGRYLGTDVTLEEIGMVEKLSRERIRQIVKKTVIKIHANSNQEVQERFPLKSFDFDKSHTLEGKRKRSQVSGGLSLKVGQLVAQGKSAPEIRETLGISAATLGNARRTLKNWGVEIPREKSLRERFAGLADPELPDQQVEKILDTVSQSAYRYLSQGENPTLRSLSDVAKDVGLFFRPREIQSISAVLRRAGIGVGFAPHRSYRRRPGEQIHSGYHFIRTLDADRAESALKQSAEVEHLKTNPVIILGKPTEITPTTYELQSSRFGAVGNLIIEIRGKAITGRNSIKLADILAEDCPISVYKYKGHYYQQDQKAELETYITNRLKELGLL